jgi:hypothetical protein
MFVSPKDWELVREDIEAACPDDARREVSRAMFDEKADAPLTANMLRAATDKLAREDERSRHIRDEARFVRMAMDLCIWGIPARDPYRYTDAAHAEARWARVVRKLGAKHKP